MKNKFVNLLAMVVLGGVAGIFGVQIFLPWLAGFSFFSRIDWIRQSREGTTIINRTEKIIVTENEVLEQAIDKAGSIVVPVIAENTDKIVGKKKTPLPSPEILKVGTGLIVSSDGLVIVAENLVPEAAQKFLVVLNGKEVAAELKKRDKVSGLALLKITENNLPVLAFFDGDLKLGQSLFLIGIQKDANKFVDMSIVKQIKPNLVVGFSGSIINGSPIFNIRGEVVGMNLADNNQSKIILSAALKELLK